MRWRGSSTSSAERVRPRLVAMLQARFVAAEHQMVPDPGREVGLELLDQCVVLVADRAVRIIEDRLRARGHGLLRQVQRGRVLVHGDRPPRSVARYTRNSSPLAIVADNTMLGNNA